MKSLFVTCILALLATSVPAVAQALRPEAVNGAILGGVAGAIIGNNSGDLRHNGARGAAIGAGTGLLLGQMVGDSQAYDTRTQVRVAAAPQTYIYRSGGYYGHGGYRGYGRYGHRWGGGYYYSPGYSYIGADVYGYSPYYADSYGRSNYAANGLFWGALTGAIIGNNSGSLRHNAWRGAGLGAAAGYLIGSIAENNARERESILTQQAAVATSRTETTAPTTDVSQPAPAVTVAKPVSSTPMSSANSLFGR